MIGPLTKSFPESLLWFDFAPYLLCTLFTLHIKGFGMEFSFLAIFAKLLEILIITHLQPLS